MDVQTIQNLAEKAISEPIYPNPSYPPSSYYRFLRILAAAVQPVYSVELGVCGGGGSLHLALGWPTGTVIGVDDANKWPNNVAHVQAHCPNFQFWHMDSIEAAEEARERGIFSVDILFIDTIHTYERTLAEFEAWKGLLCEGAVVLLDDLFRARMIEVFNILPGVKVRLDHLHDEAGFGAILL